LLKERKQILKAVVGARRQVAIAKANMLTTEKAINEKGYRPTRASIEQSILKPNNVVRPVYHGGSLTGGAVKELMTNSNVIFEGLNALVDKRAKEASGQLPDDLRQKFLHRLHTYKICLQNFDGLFSHIRQKSNLLSKEQCIVMAKRYVQAAIKGWRKLKLSVTPKVHLIEDHVIDLMTNLPAMEYYDEEFIERAHQIGMKYDRLIKSNNPAKKYDSMMEQEHACLVFCSCGRN